MKSFKKKLIGGTCLLCMASAFLVGLADQASALQINGEAVFPFNGGSRTGVYQLRSILPGPADPYSEVVFESGVDFPAGLTLNTLEELSAEFYRESGQFVQGAPRFYFGVDHVAPFDGNADSYIMAHVSNPVNTTPALQTWLPTGNLMTNGNPWETGGVGGSSSSDVATAMALAGDDTIAIIGLTQDAWDTVTTTETYWDNVVIQQLEVEAPVPEPSTIVLAMVGCLGLLRRKRQTK